MHDHFRPLARFYDRVLGPPATNLLREWLEPAQGGWTLDVAGGTGRVAESLRDLGPVAVADASPAMLARARAKGFPCVQCEAEALPFAEGTFRRVLLVDAFHHLRDGEAAAPELLRVLAPGGRLIVEEPDIRHPAVRLIALGERLLRMRSRFRRAEELADLFQAAGARVGLACERSAVWLLMEREHAGRAPAGG